MTEAVAAGWIVDRRRESPGLDEGHSAAVFAEVAAVLETTVALDPALPTVWTAATIFAFAVVNPATSPASAQRS